MKTDPVFTKILVEIKGGVIVNITDLPESLYEQFLETMHQLRIAYSIIKEKKR